MIYAAAIPLALLLGYATSSFTEPDASTFATVGLVLFVLTLPLLIKFHHVWLIFFWNASFNVFFLPAQPHFWLLLAGMSFGISWLDSLVGQRPMLNVPQLTKPLLFLAGVVLLTGFFRGGIGIRAMNSAAYGGKNYFYVLGPILGFFALAAVRIPPAKARRMVNFFLLSGTTFILSNLAFLLGPSFYFLFYLLPPDAIGTQAQGDLIAIIGGIARISGLVPTCTAVIFWLLASSGIRGLFDIARPWRLLLFCGALAGSAFGGYRNVTFMLALLLLCQFVCEGLILTRFLPIFAGFGACLLMSLMLFSDQLPLTVQRAISFFPVKVDPSVVQDAEGSTRWRLDMWQVVIPDIPKYLLLGKGYSIDPADLYFAEQETKQGLVQNYEVLRVAGDYHSGPLTLIIPFGILGVIGFLWLLGAGVKVLYQNQRFGDPALKSVNTFFLAYFITQAFVYFTIFGAFNLQVSIFTGVLGMSVALNGGVRKAVPARAVILPSHERTAPALAARF